MKGASNPSALDWGALADAVSGEVVLPGSPGYETARKPANARFHDRRPQAVVLCVTPEDVSGAISFARRSGLRTGPRSGGHCFAGRSSTEDVVIDVSPMRSVSVSGAAMVGAGARLGDVYDALDGQGLTVPAGCGPSVGISGLALGGGLGILGRRHGLTSDNLLAAQVVLADGSIVECDEQHETDLFWALRGAGGDDFGVVTSLVFGVVPVPAGTAFHVTWPSAYAAEVVAAWQTRSPAGPDELAASLLLIAPDDLAKPPEVNMFGAMLGTECDAEELLEDLVVRVGAGPASASLEHASYRETKRYLADHGPGDDRPNGHQSNKSEFSRRPLPAGAIEALVENLAEERVAGRSREPDFAPWGGAYNRVPADATAFAHREELFLLLHLTIVGPAASASEVENARRWLERSWASVRPWGTGRVYPNFLDPDLNSWARAYHGENLDRLARVKKRYDREDFFRFPQSVPGRVAPEAEVGNEGERRSLAERDGGGSPPEYPPKDEGNGTTMVYNSPEDRTKQKEGT